MQKIPFHRIYWKLEWQKAYARLYSNYVKTPNNYYSQSVLALLNSVDLKDPKLIADIGCGTGALSIEVLKMYPQSKIFAIDVSSSMLAFYNKNLKKKTGSQVRVIQGNAEEIQKYLKHYADAAFIPSAIWDMKIATLIKNLKGITNLIVFNVPYAILNKNRGFISYIENKFADYNGKPYRRIKMAGIEKILNSNGWEFEKVEYSFNLSKKSIAQFFKVLRYRYPFIFFPQMPYKKAIKLVDTVFDEMLKDTLSNGLKEEGLIFIATGAR